MECSGLPWLSFFHLRDPSWLQRSHSADYSAQKALLHIRATLHRESIMEHNCPVVLKHRITTDEWCTLSRLCWVTTMLTLLQEIGDKAICSHNPGSSRPSSVIVMKAACYTAQVQLNDVPPDYEYSLNGRELNDFGWTLRSRIIEYRKEVQQDDALVLEPPPRMPKYLVAKQQPMAAGSVF